MALTRSSVSGYLPVDSGQLYYELAGEGQTVILIHGRWGDRRHWDAQFGAFSTRYRVVRFDVRGFGRSTLPKEGVVFRNHDDLPQLMNWLEVDQAHIVGFSMGSEIAFDFAVTHPASCRSIVSIGPWVGGYNSDSATILYDFFQRLRRMIQEYGLGFAREQVVDGFFRNNLPIEETRRRLPDIASGDFAENVAVSGIEPDTLGLGSRLRHPVSD